MIPTGADGYLGKTICFAQDKIEVEKKIKQHTMHGKKSHGTETRRIATDPMWRQ